MSDTKKILKSELGKLLLEWSAEFSVFTPTSNETITIFARWTIGDTVIPDRYMNTLKPAKTLFLPSTEPMFRYRLSTSGYQIENMQRSAEKRLVFGVRPCDARAIALIDRTFNQGYEDPYYASRRQETVIVGLTCTKAPYESCFCTSVGGGPSDTVGLDIVVFDIGDEFLLRGISPFGIELINRTENGGVSTNVDEVAAELVAKNAATGLMTKVNTHKIAERLRGIFENQEFWEALSAKCLSCGVCTLLCPTCYCFDINDEPGKGEGVRWRCADSCSFTTYTKMSMENPRSEKWQRLRNRICHKYQFYPLLFDQIACTGCGRCIRLCPVSWDIRVAINSVPSPTNRGAIK